MTIQQDATDSGERPTPARTGDRRARSEISLAPVERDMAVAIGAAALLTWASYALGVRAGWIRGVDWLEALAVGTSYACTALCILQRRINYVFGAITTVLYATLFFRHGLIASAVLNVYLTPQLVYGWVRWRRDAETRAVTWLVKEWRWIPAYIGVTLAAYVGGALLVQALGGRMPWADAAILAGSILAQFLLDNKRIETWFVWIVVNVIAVWTYLTAGLVVAGLQYVVFIATAVLGFVAWRRSMR